jgi:hypothetical protein
VVLGPQALSPAYGAYHSNDQGNFGNNTVWQWTLTLPDKPTTQPGQISVAEYGGVPNLRMANLSTMPCDLRTTIDPTGVNGPITAGGGNAATIYFTTSPNTGYPYLKPGTTYYYNAYNYDAGSGQWTCARSNCQAVINWVDPRGATMKVKKGATKKRHSMQKEKASPVMTN